jgi:uncharacterized protein (TIGR03435 family)
MITANPMVKLRRNLLLLSTAPMAIGVIAAQSPRVTDWQTAAGGKMAFEVASVKPGKVPKIPNFPLDNRDAKTRGGRFSASFPLSGYISFAFKLSPCETNLAASVQLPKWFDTGLFEIEAQSGGNPTEDQMRLTMQSLLADRFKLAVHFESWEAPVFALNLVRPGRIGPKLRPHQEGPACPDSFSMLFVGPNPNPSDVWPPVCETAQSRRTPNGLLIGSRNTTMGLLADAIYGYGSIAGEPWQGSHGRGAMAGEPWQGRWISLL